ncbi:MAG: HAD-IA family hydrolase [Actinomycetota bacterium]|jgi:HAD superfamily hydrolase (TIGR01509 family)
MTRPCLVLDFDGTILDTEGPVYRSWWELWSDHGEELVLAEWQAIIGTDGVFDPWAELLRRTGRSLDPVLLDRRRARRDELLAGHAPRPGVLEWLDEADDLGVPVGVASSSPPEWVERHLARLGLRQRFACLVCCDGVVPVKPDPTSYRLACDRLGGDPGRSVAVEDSPHGVVAALGAGLLTVAVPHPLTDGLDLSAAHLTLRSLEEMTLAAALAAAELPRA